MVRKTVFNRDDVIAAGLAVIGKDGLGSLSARRVAEELGASTAPVYSNFANMDELAVALRTAVAEQILAFTEEQYTEDTFLNMGIGVLEFARQNPGLYSSILMEAGSTCDAGPRVMGRLAERMASLETVDSLPAAERVMLLHQLSIFTHGLAVQICSGLTEGFRFDDLILLLQDAGEGMMKHALSRPERTSEQQRLMKDLMELYAKEDDSDD